MRLLGGWSFLVTTIESKAVTKITSYTLIHYSGGHLSGFRSDSPVLTVQRLQVMTVNNSLSEIN